MKLSELTYSTLTFSGINYVLTGHRHFHKKLLISEKSFRLNGGEMIKSLIKNNNLTPRIKQRTIGIM